MTPSLTYPPLSVRLPTAFANQMVPSLSNGGVSRDWLSAQVTEVLHPSSPPRTINPGAWPYTCRVTYCSPPRDNGQQVVESNDNYKSSLH